MKLFLSIILISACSLSTVNSQNSGWAGKRVLLTTNLVTGKFTPLINVGLQVVAFRSWTFSAHFARNKYQNPVKYLINEYTTDFGIVGGYDYQRSSANARSESDLLNTDMKANVSSMSLAIEARKYLSRNVMPAPKGFFVSLAAKLSRVDVEGVYYRSLVDELRISYDNYRPEIRYPYDYKGMLALGFHAGVGYQLMITRRVTLAAQSTFDITTMDITNNHNGKVLSGIAKRFGSNIIAMNGLGKENIWVDYNKRVPPFKRCWGFSGQIQLGFLLF